MFDMLHVLYETDVTPRWEQDSEIKDKIRSSLYESMYGKPYKFAAPKSASSNTFGLPPGEDLDSIPDLPDVPVESRETKSYIPPTDPEDLPSILDAPVN